MLSIITSGNDYEELSLSQAKEYQMGGHLRREHYRLPCYRVKRRECMNYTQRGNSSNMRMSDYREV